MKASTFTEELGKLRLAINCLRGEALDQVLPHIGNDRINLDNLAALTTILDRAFGNPNRVVEAEAKLQSITQGRREFSSYYAEFQRHAMEVTWDEPSKMAALKLGTDVKLKKHLIRSDRLTTLNTINLLVESPIEIDMHECQYQAESSARTTNTTHQHSP